MAVQTSFGALFSLSVSCALRVCKVLHKKKSLDTFRKVSREFAESLLRLFPKPHYIFPRVLFPSGCQASDNTARALNETHPCLLGKLLVSEFPKVSLL